MLILLPLAAFGAIYLALLGWPGDTTEKGRREALIGAALIWGALLAGGMEALSWARAIQPAGLAAWWLAASTVVIVLGRRRGALDRGWRRLRTPIGGLTGVDRILLGGLLFLMGMLFLVALLSPPNNVDSLNHHMVRVAHWASNGSLEPYATNRNGQLNKPPLAELAILNARVLQGDDQTVNLVQWSAMAISLAIVSLLASRLGCHRREQLLAAVFGLSVPLGLLLASNTKNDHVVTLWVLCLVFFAVVSAKRPLSRAEVAGAGLAVGLGLLTKGTFQLFAFPFLVWLFFNFVRQAGWRRGGLQGISVLAVALLLNLPYWARNIRTFGGPFGNPVGLVRALEVDEIGGFSAGEEEVVGPPPSESKGLVQRLTGRFASLLALNTIYPGIGGPLRDWLARMPTPLAPDFLDSLDEGVWNHEDSAGNLLHLVMLSASTVAVAILAFRRRDGVLGAYALATVAGYGALTLVSAATDLWGLRYQLSFFIIGAPLVAVAATALSRRWLTSAMIALLLLASVPYVAMNGTRPLVASPPRTRSASILTAPTIDILSNASPRLGANYEAAAQTVLASSCREVGVSLRRGDLEYILWRLLAAPQSGVRIETISPSPETARFADPDFRPCAIVCTVCAEQAAVESNPLALDLGYVRVYLAEP
jgi:4-amino-4-deoxy-L-arabinose transferase-like glycosyltransferase